MENCLDSRPSWMQLHKKNHWEYIACLFLMTKIISVESPLLPKLSKNIKHLCSVILYSGFCILVHLIHCEQRAFGKAIYVLSLLFSNGCSFLTSFLAKLNQSCMFFNFIQKRGKSWLISRLHLNIMNFLKRVLKIPFKAVWLFH